MASVKKPQADAALILIDVQTGFDEPYWGKRNNPQGEATIAKLLKLWRERGAPVIHIRHSSTNPQSPLWREKSGFEFKPEAMPLPGEPIYTKQVNSGFIGTTLEADLREKGITELVMVGYTTNHCVSTTARMAGNLGFAVWLVADGCVTHDRVGYDGKHWDAQTLHETALASLKDEFATVLDFSALKKH